MKMTSEIQKKRQKYIERQRLYKERHPDRVKYNKYRQRARNKGFIFEISKEDFMKLINMPCHYCGELPNKNLNGIDRKDNSIGYSLENCLPCCWGCNELKGSKDYEWFIIQCKKISNHLRDSSI